MLTLRKDWRPREPKLSEWRVGGGETESGRTRGGAALFAPDETQALESVETTKRFVVASLLENVQGRLKAWRFADSKWQEAELPHLPSGALK